jgi:hypothetical protein
MSLKLPKATLCVPCALYLGVMAIAVLAALVSTAMHSRAFLLTLEAAAALMIVGALGVMAFLRLKPPM